QDVEVAYMTNNVNWHADYVLTLDADDKLGDLAGWVTVDNKSGATYRNSVLKVVAGQVNVATPQRNMLMKAQAMEVMSDAAGAGPQFHEQALFEYHMYDLKRKTTIKDGQTKQISLLGAAAVPMLKEFVIEGQGGWWYTRQFSDPDAKQPVNVVMSFRNSEVGHLGMPLPAGTIRLYKKDHDGNAQFIGEDNVRHTPKDEEVRLKVGEAFDVVAERRQTAFQRVSNRVYESEWEIHIRNHKAEDIVVYVVESLAGFSDWSITQHSHPFTKPDAARARFEVPVAKDGEAVLTYTSQVNY
ncbi:MAG: DUF4139 domain-containing protein, partial [Candidatus Omnitrophica bacterium]|nr:DUF4139 domain-containing protein [Candidatus Omnitrophota bacterium]